MIVCHACCFSFCVCIQHVPKSVNKIYGNSAEVSGCLSVPGSMLECFLLTWSIRSTYNFVARSSLDWDLMPCRNLLQFIDVFTVWVWGFLTFFPKRLGIFSSNFTHLLYVPIYARVQIFIQLPTTLTKLRHIKCDQPANFYISLELQLLNLLTEQMTSLVTSCHIRQVCWHYNIVLC